MKSAATTFEFTDAIPQSSLALPSHPHIPRAGDTPIEPDWPVLEAAKKLAPPATSESDWQNNQAYIYGFTLLRAGYYWEAHEVWELVWLSARPNSRARALLRALIQTANCHLKHTMGHVRAARRILFEIKADLATAGRNGTFMGVDLDAMRAALDEFDAALQRADRTKQS